MASLENQKEIEWHCVEKLQNMIYSTLDGPCIYVIHQQIRKI